MQSVIKKKNLPFITPSCELFEPCEIIKDGDVGERKGRPFHFIDGKLVNFTATQVDDYVKDLASKNKIKRIQALNTLASLAYLKNQMAIKALYDYFSTLPVPEALKEVHFKKELFEKIDFVIPRDEMIPLFVRELKSIESNNIIRQWMSTILHYLSLVLMI